MIQSSTLYQVCVFFVPFFIFSGFIRELYCIVFSIQEELKRKKKAANTKRKKDKPLLYIKSVVLFEITPFWLLLSIIFENWKRVNFLILEKKNFWYLKINTIQYRFVSNNKFLIHNEGRMMLFYLIA